MTVETGLPSRVSAGHTLPLRRLLTSLVAASALAAMSAATFAAGAQHAPGRLGRVLTTKDGGQIFGFDVDQNGNDGVLASANLNTNWVSVETFDQDTGKITRSFAKYQGSVNSYAMDAIFAGDVALVTHYIVPQGQIYAHRVFELMNPVTAKTFTGDWTPPIKNLIVNGVAENQSTSTAVVLVAEPKHNDKPDLIVSNIAANTFAKVIPLDPNLFGGGNGPQLGQYAAGNAAVLALSPDGGTVGGQAPVNVLVDLNTGTMKQFSGYNTGPYHAGYVNGLATDPNNGISATDTELNAQVEIYDMAHQTGIADVQLPCTGDADQSYSGSGIAVDPVHKLFLVTETADACSKGATSSIVVFDESGKYIETITGFQFAIGEPAPAINPTKRMGWAFGGPGFAQLQQFFY